MKGSANIDGGLVDDTPTVGILKDTESGSGSSPAIIYQLLDTSSTEMSDTAGDQMISN